MKEFPRYSRLDSYTLEELRRKYQTSDPKARIDLLQNFYKDDTAPPFEIALLAVEDSNIEVRQWIARHGKYLDYREYRRVDDKTVYEFPERNFEDRLKNDPDAFVRACLRENPDVFGGIAIFSDKWIEYFAEATHIERLALVRNPEVIGDLIEKIFDPEDQELGINLEERKELALAFLTNKETLNRMEAEAGLGGHRLKDGGDWYDANEFFKKLWNLAPKWPTETDIQIYIYAYVPANDETKVEHYRRCDKPVWRRLILRKCHGNDTKTIELGMEDPDELTRHDAYCKVGSLEPDKLEAILQREDEVNLSALATNKSLPLRQLEKVRERLDEVTKDKVLGGDLWLDMADETIREVRRRQATDDPEDLFDEDYEEDGGRSVGEKSIKRAILLVLGAFIGLYVGHNFLGFWTEKAYDTIGLIFLIVFFAWLVERWINDHFVATHRRLNSIEKKIGRLKGR